MKPNLETIKKALHNHFQRQDAVSFSKLKGEIEDFEKRLRERKENLESILETSRTEETFHFRRGIIHLVKELLENV